MSGQDSTSGIDETLAAGAATGPGRLTALLDHFGSRLGLMTAFQSTAKPSHRYVELEAEILRLSRDRARIAAENQLLNEILNQSGDQAAGRLLRRLIPQPADGLAALVELDIQRDSPSNLDATVTVPALAVRGAGTSTEISVTFPKAILEQLGSHVLLLRTFRLQSLSGSSVQMLLESDSHPGARDIYLIPLHDDNRIAGLLATTTLWPIGLHPNEQSQILGRSGLTVLQRLLSERRYEQHRRELQMAREMLHLKSITDRATEQPLDTLGEFLSDLCETVEMDRAALFLEFRRERDNIEPVLEAGVPLPATIETSWRHHEARLAQAAVNLATCRWYDEEQLQSLGIHTLVRQGVACPLHSAGKRLGTLVLSRQECSDAVNRNEPLIEWGTDVLAQTLRRIHRDAAIRRQARHDGLTDLANRRTFDTLLAGELDRIRMGISEECSLLLADLDRFKSINDQHGHQAGDEVLRVVAQRLREQVSRMRVGERSLLARYGGEELAILLPGVGLPGAVRVAEEIRAAIEHSPVSFNSKWLPVTVSIGVASCPIHGLGSSDVLAAADAALYRAKSEGRNRVCRPNDASH
jgi:diguanylate cyclase (GGDEF)-like protein